MMFSAKGSKNRIGSAIFFMSLVLSIQVLAQIPFDENSIQGSLRPYSCNLIDFDTDSDIDILSSEGSSVDGRIIFWQNDGFQQFSPVLIDDTFIGPGKLVVGDFDFDGDMDLSCGSMFGSGIAWWQNQGNQSYIKHSFASSISEIRALEVEDIDSDGDMDFLVLLRPDAQTFILSLWENDGSFNLTELILVDSTYNSNTYGISEVYSFDMNNDGILDIISSSPGLGIFYYEGQGNLSFLEKPVPNRGQGHRGADIADIDGDGDLDIVGLGNASISVWLNNGNGDFTYSLLANSIELVHPNPNTIVAADLDGDLDIDLTTCADAFGGATNPNWSNATVWLNDGQLNYEGHSLSYTFEGLFDIDIHDIDGDLLQDIAMVSHEQNEIRWWKNKLLNSVLHPKINLSHSVLNNSTDLTINGSSFSPSATIDLSWTSNGNSQSVSITTSEVGTFTHVIAYDPMMPPGLYHVQAYDSIKELNTTTLNFLVEGEVTADLVITKSFESFSIQESENFTVTWKDKLLFDESLTSSTTGQRSYNYHLVYSQDGGNTWLDPLPATGSAIELTGSGYVGDIVTLDAQIMIPSISSGTILRVVDWHTPTRTDDSESFEVLSTSGSPHVDIRKKFDHSFPIDVLTGLSLLEDANGVAADGVARLILKVKNNTTTNPITSMSIELVDEDDGFGTTTAMLGKVMPATIVNEYTDEANVASQIQISAPTSPIQHEYYFWYVAPDDFNQNHGLYNTRSSRNVTVKFDIAYQDGYTEIVSQNIEIVRPPLMMIHGLAGNSSSWDHFKYQSSTEQKFIEGSEFSVSKAVNIHPNSSFYENAKLLLNVEFANAQADQTGLIEIEKNSYQGILYDLRKKGYAANQVDCIVHSMGGSVVRESTLLPEYYNNDISHAYNNYGKGYINKFISLHTPHAGSPLADLLDDFVGDLGQLVPCGGNSICDLKVQTIEHLGEEVISYYLLNNPGSFVNNFIDFQQPGGLFLGNEPVPTDAVLDLRILEGEKFPEVTIPSHAFAGDIMPGSIPDYSNVFQSALEFGQNYNEFAQRFMDFFYANVDVPSSIEVLTLPLEEQQYWNDLAAAKEQIESDAGLLKWFEKFIAIYQVFDFIQDSDVIVSLNSQLGLLDEVEPHTTVHDNLGHMSSWGPLQSIAVGNDVFNLLNTGVSNIAFDNFPETFPSSSLNTSTSRSSSNGLNSDSMFIRRQPGVVPQGISIIEPDSISSSEIGEQLTITVRLEDTVGLQHISIYYQHEGYNFLPPWDTIISLTVQTSGLKLDTQQILAVGLYDYEIALNLDSTAYSIDEVRIDVSTTDVLQDFRVTPLVNHMTVDEFLAPEYLAIYQTLVAPIGAFDSELDVIVNDTTIVRFNKITKEFFALSEGATYADVTYADSTRRIFFDVSDPCLYPDRSALIEIYKFHWNQSVGPPNLYWDTTTCNICEWEGVVCNNKNRVEELNLSNRVLRFWLSDALADLTELKKLDVSGNWIWALPSNLAELSNLVYLNVGDNFRGLHNLPSNFNLLSNLEFLDLTDNQLSNISQIDSTFSNLLHLNVENNDLSSFPMELLGIESLEYLNIGENPIYQLPTGIGALVNLKYLHVEGDSISELPNSIGNMNSLILLKAGQNQIDALPQELYNLSTLGGLFLDNNNLNSFPEGVAGLVNLQALDLSFNQIVDTIPKSIGELLNLRSLYLHNNNLYGQIPDDIGNLKKIVRLYLQNNDLTGCIPSSMQYHCNSPYQIILNNVGMVNGGDYAQFCADGAGMCECSKIVQNPGSEGFGTLRSAINCASTNDTITFGRSMQNSTVQLASPEILIDKNLIVSNDFTESYSTTISNQDINNTNVLIRVMDEITFDKIKLIGKDDESFIIKTGSGGSILMNEGYMEKVNIQKE